jgi:hypothetical protein
MDYATLTDIALMTQQVGLHIAIAMLVTLEHHVLIMAHRPQVSHTMDTVYK